MTLLQYRVTQFTKNKRAFFSLVIFVAIFLLSLNAPFIANDRPILIYKNGNLYFPIIFDYSERDFGGEFYTIDYRDKYVLELLRDAVVVYPPVFYSYDTIDLYLENAPPTSPSREHILGTDDLGRDVFARLLYGTRTSLLFGITLSFFGALIGIVIGATGGYYGGLIDLISQRIIEIWNGVPVLFLIIILSSFFTPGFFMILFIVLMFSWGGIVNVVRAEFLRTRAQDYILASKVFGASDLRIIFYHALPNSLVATITYIPFMVSGSIATLVSLDFLGFGMPLGSASLGELLNQGKNNIDSLHLAITGFMTTGTLLSLLIFIGEGVRDAFGKRL